MTCTNKLILGDISVEEKQENDHISANLFYSAYFLIGYNDRQRSDPHAYYADMDTEFFDSRSGSSGLYPWIQDGKKSGSWIRNKHPRSY
jgi:hypothetical protein